MSEKLKSSKIIFHRYLSRAHWISTSRSRPRNSSFDIPCVDQESQTPMQQWIISENRLGRQLVPKVLQNVIVEFLFLILTCLLGHHRNCSSTQWPVEFLENIPQNLRNKLPPQTVEYMHRWAQAPFWGVVRVIFSRSCWGRLEWGCLRLAECDGVGEVLLLLQPQPRHAVRLGPPGSLGCHLQVDLEKMVWISTV